jgi:hypothetical protein
MTRVDYIMWHETTELFGENTLLSFSAFELDMKKRVRLFATELPISVRNEALKRMF